MTVAPVAGPWTTKYRGMANDDDDVANVQPDVSSADCPAISRVQVAEQRRCDGRAPSGPQVGRFKKVRLFPLRVALRSHLRNAALLFREIFGMVSASDGV